MLPASSGPTITGGPLLSTTAKDIEVTETRVAAHAVGLSKVYGSGDARVVALDDVDVAFAAGEFAAIMGPSGRVSRR